MTLVLGMTVVGCGDDSSKDDPIGNPISNPISNPTDNTQTFPVAKGKLTVNGLSNFNDKYVYVQGLAGSSVLVGLTDITGYPSDIAYKLAKISGGKAEIPLYMANDSASSYSNSYVAYDGNDIIRSVSVIILSEDTLKSSNAASAIMNNLGMKSLTSGTFSSGNITIEWGNSADGTETGNGIWTPPEGVIPIPLSNTNNISWINGNIPTKDSVQWFTFTTTDYRWFEINFSFNIANEADALCFYLYKNNGDVEIPIPYEVTNPYAFIPENLWFSVPIDKNTGMMYHRVGFVDREQNSKYYIKVTSYEDYAYGAYQISFISK